MIETGEDQKQETKSQKRMKKVKNETVDKDTGEIEESFLDEDETPTVPVRPKSEPEKVVKENSEIPFYKFSLGEIVIAEKEKMPVRTLTLKVSGFITEFQNRYDFLMLVDLDKFDRRIESERRMKADFETENQMDMFNEMKKKELAKYDERIQRLINDRQKLIDLCPDISFSGKIVRIDDSKNYPVFTLLISMEASNVLNASWDLMANYKIQLQ